MPDHDTIFENLRRCRGYSNATRLAVSGDDSVLFLACPTWRKSNSSRMVTGGDDGLLFLACPSFPEDSDLQQTGWSAHVREIDGYVVQRNRSARGPFLEEGSKDSWRFRGPVDCSRGREIWTRAFRGSRAAGASWGECFFQDVSFYFTVNGRQRVAYWSDGPRIFPDTSEKTVQHPVYPVGTVLKISKETWVVERTGWHGNICVCTKGRSKGKKKYVFENKTGRLSWPRDYSRWQPVRIGSN